MGSSHQGPIQEFMAEGGGGGWGGGGGGGTIILSWHAKKRGSSPNKGIHFKAKCNDEHKKHNH